MKKILFVALAATLLAAGCQKTEIINPVGNPIGFSTGLNKLTKADDATTPDPLATLKTQSFSVWAFYAADDEHTTVDDTNAPYGGIENTPVTFSTTTSKWGTTEQYYWPGVGKELKFFAASADAATIGTKESSKVSISDDRTTMTITDFIVNPSDPTVDLMVADIVQQHQDDKVVDMTFHHALSKVEFIFKTITNEDNLTVVVNSLSVADLATKGTFTTAAPAPTPTPGDEEPETPATRADGDAGATTAYQGAVTEVSMNWTSVTVPQPFNKPLNAETMTLTNEPQVFSSWLVLPQPIAGKTVTVSYVIGEKPFTSVFKLDKGLTAWNPNQQIKYTITLAPNLITFNPTVDEWDVPTDIEHQN